MASVLLVDPDPFVRSLLRALIETFGHAVLEVENEEGALEVLRDRTGPLIVVLSSRTRPEDGLHLLQAIATDARLREAYGYLLLSKEAAWLPQAFQRLHELLVLRRLDASRFGQIGQAIGEMAEELGDRQRAKTRAGS